MTDLYHGDGWRLSEDEVALPGGGVQRKVRVHRPDTVHVLPLLTPDTVLLLREYRPFFQEWLWVIPSGKANAGEDLLAAAQRELQEEAGYRAGSIEPFGSCIHSETFDYRNRLFLARELTLAPLSRDADEQIEVHELPVEEALTRVLACNRVHSTSAFALFKYLHECQS